MNPQDRDALEALIDRTNLSSVLEALADICSGKAAHLQENWQEKVTSSHVRFWHVWGNKLETASRAAGLSERDLGTWRRPA